MYWEILLGLSCLLSLFWVWRFSRLKKHDHILFRFCQIRRDIMGLLRHRGFELKKNDYVQVRGLLDIVNVTIHEYDKCKSTLFNFRKFTAHLKALKRKSGEIEKIKIHDREIEEIVKRHRVAMFEGFIAYTPFIKHELALKFVVFTVRLLAKTGVASVRKQAENFLWLRSQISDMQHRHA